MIAIKAKGIDIDVPKNYFPNDDPDAAAAVDLARACESAVLQLAELLCIPSKRLMIWGRASNSYQLNIRGDATIMKIESRLAQIGSIKEPVTGAVSFPIYQCNSIPSSAARSEHRL